MIPSPPDGAYRPISDYALVGNRHTCALVSRDGSIDWCCLPRLESPSVFAALLDARRGGRWRIAPAGEATVSRGYLGFSAVLRTEFRGAGGVLRLTDFLPIRAGASADRQSESSHCIVRHVRCTEGEAEVDVEWTPRPNYAREDVVLSREGRVVFARSPKYELALAGFPEGVPLPLHGASLRARVRLRAGEGFNLACAWGGADPDPVAWTAEHHLERTLAWWAGWAASCTVPPGAEEWTELVLRSGMVLKLLTNEGSGAIAAAPTTSLPEELGGVRNWDYRFCWVRDSSMIARALLALGHDRDAREFLDFLERAAAQHRDPARIQVVYGLRGETRLTEYTLGHLDGYRGSSPVRIGNGAALQRQLDIYGELLEAARELARIGAPPTPERRAWLGAVADYVCSIWRIPDRGIWEVRGPERHFTYSKVMCWVALDRALVLAETLGLPGDAARWAAERDAVREAVLRDGYDPGQGAFTQSFGSPTLDASALLLPIVGFLPPDDPRVHGTVDAVLRTLTREGLVFRYPAGETPDGVGGGEGAFGICTFWLAHALALCGRREEAREVFSGMAARANDVGLFAEEVDPATGAFLGNFPQAFTHVGLIDAARALGLAGCRADSAAAGPRPASALSTPGA
ncbi:MAG TPA: glycoside hydrolase family 15 protein [Longimicrobiaceae bacterium]|nr:glycoside hydrolase family 15 protein [Longimicrobiaceae bacterium]